MWPFSSFVQNRVDFCTRLYPASNEISTYKLQNRVCVRVVLTHVRVPIYVLNLILSNICIIQMSINFLCNQTMQLFCISVRTFPWNCRSPASYMAYETLNKDVMALKIFAKYRLSGLIFKRYRAGVETKTLPLHCFFFS